MRSNPQRLSMAPTVVVNKTTGDKSNAQRLAVFEIPQHPHIKKRLIKTAKVGRQYRILGKEILHLVSPKLESKVSEIYNKGRRWVYTGIGEQERFSNYKSGGGGEKC